LQAFSRNDETPRQPVIEPNAAGTDYQALGDFLDDDFAHHWEVPRMVLNDAPRKLTRQRVLDEGNTAWRALVLPGLLETVGPGGQGRKEKGVGRQFAAHA
jgi:hypothetical protein